MTGTGATVDRSSQIHPVARLPEEWRAWLEHIGERPFRANQIFRWIFAQGELDPRRMTDLPASLRERMSSEGMASPVVAEVRRSRDGTRKLLLDLSGGGRVECVIIPMSDEAEPEDADAAAAPDDPDDEVRSEEGARPRRRITLCISTQVGCAMGCVFCASGRRGLVRGLAPEEIVSQVILAKRYLEGSEYVRNLVFMGMGEPLHHYDRTARAIRLLTHPSGLGMSPRRITVSTVGLVPGIERLGRDFDGKVGLALSLHAPNDEARSRIIPMNEKYPLRALVEALRAYPLPKRRRITIEYTLIAGENDQPRHAEELIALLRGLRVKVNLIPMNPVTGSSLSAPNGPRVEAFREALASAGLSCFVRKRRGDDVDAACGQLALASELVRDRNRCSTRSS